MAKRLDDLELSDFDDAPMWSSGAEHCDEEVVGPLIGRDSLRNGESNMWVRFQGSLADQTPVAGIAMAESPPPTLLAWSFFVGGEWLVLHLPPAPDFVLRDSGPEAFAHKLERRIDQVFPICITSEILAEETGQRITVAIASDGRAG